MGFFIMGEIYFMVNLEEVKEKWKEKTKKCKPYLHFDCRKNSQNIKLQKYITNPQKIARHSFYPFLHYTISMRKFNKQNPSKPRKKERKINCSAHIDRLIFSYYSRILNSEYNKYVSKKEIDKNIIAYRDNLRKSNIHFSKEAFDFIRKHKSCFIVIGDFSNFFDNLDHNYLKNQICKILNVNKLSDDWYAIYKNITKFSFCELEEIKEFSKLEKEKLKNSRLLSPEFFRKLRKEKLLKINKNLEKGIPQGSAISAVLANVYMNEFDYKLKQYTKKFNGEYFRYSDDFILIFPMEINKNINFIREKIQKIKKKIPNLELQEEKTQCFYYCNNKITILAEKNKIGYCFKNTNIYILNKKEALKNYIIYKKIYKNVNCKNKLKKKKIIQTRNNYKIYSKKLNFFEMIKKLLNNSSENKKKFYCIYKEFIISLSDEKIKYKDLISYLGFSFDGKNIYIRDKTLSKYYYRMYRKIKTINKSNRVTKKGNIISCRVLYSKYSQKGNKNSSVVTKQNFIGYVGRAMKIFTKLDNKNIAHVKKIHYKKIKDRLIKVDEELLKKTVRKNKRIENFRKKL